MPVPRRRRLRWRLRQQLLLSIYVEQRPRALDGPVARAGGARAQGRRRRADDPAHSAHRAADAAHLPGPRGAAASCGDLGARRGLVAPAVRRPRPNLLLVTAGMAALAFLLVMIVSGRTRPMQSLVAFEAAGLMREAPDQIDRVDLEASGHRWTSPSGRMG